MNPDCVHWQRLFEETLAGNLFAAPTLRERVTILPGNLLPVFRVAVAGFVGGTVQIELRFGFENPDADGSSDVITFPVLSANGGATRRLTYAATLSNVSVPTVPPRVSIFATTAAVVGFTGNYSVHAAMRGMK